MTTTRAAASHAVPAEPFRLPDIPERHPDDMTSYDNLHQYGAAANLIQQLGNPDTTIVSAEHYVVPGPAYAADESRYPDLLVAFDVNPVAYRDSNGYIVSEQGKPPDFILEVASRRTANDDLRGKKDYYEGLRVSEYWLFDSDAEFYGFTLAGYRLERGGYRAIAVSEIAPGALQGYSAALRLNLRAEAGYLGWHDPDTGEHIPTLHSETARAEAERVARVQETARAEAERVARVQETARAEAERAARVRETARAEAAEAEARELRDQLRRRRS